MKKKRIDFETKIWEGVELDSWLSVMRAFFRVEDLVTLKEQRNEMLRFAFSSSCAPITIGYNVFWNYLCMRSFLKACFVLSKQTYKWRLSEPLIPSSNLMFASLSKQEYHDPFSIFRDAFEKYSLKDFECFNSQVLHLSMEAFSEVLEVDLLVLQHFLVKMLDGAQLILERDPQRI